MDIILIVKVDLNLKFDVFKDHSFLIISRFHMVTLRLGLAWGKKKNNQK